MALEAAVVERESRWTSDREFAATSVEIMHGLLISTLKIAGAKNVGKPLHIPRPWDVVKPQMISMGQFARQVKGEANA